MATNFYFDQYNNNQEQLLIEDLIIEAIKIYGLEMFYLPRTLVNRDELYTEDDSSRYNSAHNIEMYIKNTMGFAGQGDILTKFNLQIRDQLTLTVARRAWQEEVGDSAGLTRPREGDLIFFPLNRKIFRINFVEHESIFYQMGALQTYDLQCELFEYSNEVFATGIDYIDALDDDYIFNLAGEGLLTETLDSIVNEYTLLPIILEQQNIQVGTQIDEDNDWLNEQANTFINWSEQDPFADGPRY